MRGLHLVEQLQREAAHVHAVGLLELVAATQRDARVQHTVFAACAFVGVKDQRIDEVEKDAVLEAHVGHRDDVRAGEGCDVFVDEARGDDDVGSVGAQAEFLHAFPRRQGLERVEDLMQLGQREAADLVAVLDHGQAGQFLDVAAGRCNTGGPPPARRDA